MSGADAGAPATGLRLLTDATEILATSDIVRKVEPTPEWGEGTGVLVQSMTSDQRFAFGQAGQIVTRDKRGGVQFEVNLDRNSTVALVVCSVVNEDGEPVFSKAHVEALAKKNAAPLERIAALAMRLSGLTAEVQEELSAGLKATNGTNGASHSGSPVTSG